MTVAELIKKLENCSDKEAPVKLYISNGECEASAEAGYVIVDGFGEIVIGYEEEEE